MQVVGVHKSKEIIFNDREASTYPVWYSERFHKSICVTQLTILKFYPKDILYDVNMNSIESRHQNYKNPTGCRHDPTELCRQCGHFPFFVQLGYEYWCQFDKL